MNKIWTIGRTEYLQAVRSKAFLIGVFVMPVMWSGMILFQRFVEDQVDLTPRRCAVVDPTGELWPVLEGAVEARNAAEIWEGEGEERRQVQPAFELERVEPAGAEDWKLGLARRVEGGELQGYLLIAADVLGEGTTTSTYHTDEPSYTALYQWMRKVLNAEVQRRRMQEHDLEAGLVQSLMRPVPFADKELHSEGAAGEVVEGGDVSKLRTFGVPFGAVMLMFMLVMTSAPQLMNNVLEEKMQRISEVLVSGVTPFQLLMGKLVSGALISLSLAALYLGGVIWAVNHFGVADLVPGSVYGWFVLMMIFATFMYGALFSALGSACSELRDSQTMVFPAMLVVMLPFFAAMPILENPNGSIAQAMTYVPTATPMILMLRLLTQPGPPLWEVVLGLADCVLTMLLLIWVSAKIFRVGILSQGQAPTFRRLLGWVVAK